MLFPFYVRVAEDDPAAKLSSYPFTTLMPMELVTATPIRRLRNAFIQLAGTHPGGDCRDSNPENYSQVRTKQIRHRSQGRADSLLWKRLLHPLWRAACERGPILRWLWGTAQLARWARSSSLFLKEWAGPNLAGGQSRVAQVRIACAELVPVCPQLGEHPTLAGQNS
jgi:hypothetical protein